MPEISIIIPVYNAQKTLTNCLKSISNQTFKNYEIIAVNDGSTDQSQAILKNYQDRITLINQPNLGAQAARNTGAKAARGQFLLFCDADLVLKPEMLEKMLATLKHNPNAAYVYSRFKFGFKTFKLWPFDPVKLKKMPYIHTTSLIRRECFPGFDQKLKRLQDWDLWLTMLERGHIGHFLPEILFQVKAGGTMSNWLPEFLYHFPWLKKIKQYKAAEKIIKTKHHLI